MALSHPAAPTLVEYATTGCPVRTGRQWTREEVEAAVERGAHQSVKSDECMAQLRDEAEEKERRGQARILLWDDIKKNLPPHLKVSPIAMVSHKSRKWRAILDLSFRLRLQNGGEVPSVNDNSEKTGPQGSIDQLGHSLLRMIHAFAEAEEEDLVFMAKWDVKDGFWRLDCEDGEEWNFAYFLTQPAKNPVKRVVPTLLQMG